MIQVFCKNSGQFKAFPEGTTLLEMLPQFDFDKPYPILSSKVNNISEGLRFKVFNNRDVEYLDFRTYAGRGTYCRSLCFLLSKSARDIFPGCRISMRRPISKGYFCALEKEDGTSVTPDDVDRIRERMTRLVEKGVPFRRHEEQTGEVIRRFREAGYEDKAKLLETSGEVYTTYYTLEGSADYYYDALVPSTDYLKVWSVSPYMNGILLRIPDRHAPDQLAPFVDQPKTFGVFQEYTHWNRIMGLSNVGDVNESIIHGHASDLIQISEALQEKKIVQIAEEVDRRFHSVVPTRLVLITGPSSSGKSTVCRRLSIQLKACGLHPVFFSTDDYFVNRVDTPKLPDGSYDFDNFDTVDHALMERDILRLLAGEEVEIPHYNFVTGLREYNGRRESLDESGILLIEGIHALNPALTAQVPEAAKYKIFINTIISISLDDHNCIPTSDNRLLRRIVRDYKLGSFTACETISQWPNVRRSESRWIYPYQENADVLFNSAYLIEFAVMRNHAERVLSTVPKNCPQYSEAHRLLKFLHYFTPVSDREIPSTSMLREFILP